MNKNKTRQVLDDYVVTLLTESDTPVQEAAIHPAVEQITEEESSNLVPFPAKTDVKTLRSSLESMPDPVSEPILELQSQPKTEVELQPFKEPDLPKVDLTSHTQLNVAQKLLQAYELRQQQEIKTQQKLKQQQQISVLVKQAADNKLSLGQKEKLLTLLIQKQWLRQAEIVQAAIDLETKQQTKQQTEQLQQAETATERPQDPFQSLIFHVGSLKVAVPLENLGGIHPIHGEITPIVGKPQWYMGIVDHNGNNHHLVDTAYWITPENYQQLKTDYTHYIILGDSDWGIACNKIGNAITLSHSDIKWASKNSKKTWFAGMLVDEMCALLDIDNFIQELLDSGIAH